MPSRYPEFDRRRLQLLPLAQRKHDMDLSKILAVGERPMPFEHPDLAPLAEAMKLGPEQKIILAQAVGHLKD